MSRTPEQDKALKTIETWAKRLVISPPLKPNGLRLASQEILEAVAALTTPGTPYV